MAFMPKTWVGRSVQYPGRIRLIPTGENGVFDVQRAEGKIAADGDLVSDVALNDLEQRILTAILSKADGTDGAANNALALGGIAAANYPKISSGTWTPTLFGETVAGSPVYVSRSGVWRRTGNKVDLVFSVLVSSLGGLAGAVFVGGLPFGITETNNGGTDSLGFVRGLALSATDKVSGYNMYNNGLLITKSNASGVFGITNTDITDAFEIRNSKVSYYVA